MNVYAWNLARFIRATPAGKAMNVRTTGSNRAFHPDGEVAVAKAARAGNHLQFLSTGASTSVEDATQARGAPVWFQLYPTDKWEVTEALVRRAERATRTNGPSFRARAMISRIKLSASELDGSWVQRGGSTPSIGPPSRRAFGRRTWK